MPMMGPTAEVYAFGGNKVEDIFVFTGVPYRSVSLNNFPAELP